ncbi:glycosyltransferase family 2 protein [Clostridium sp. E02]|uniref:glycosyltransferase family 2 protein n=1 Tax=Clostridium sp. E02 TaxID=2487134 RepID=UPI000F524848|nr:glycosyltransferase family 2 protein [Clostridium sp. E02]
MISVILPACNEEKMIEKAYFTIVELLRAEKIIYEIIFIDDGSKDGTWDEIRSLEQRGAVKGITFSRNFGKEAAIMAGLTYASGDCCVVMDCDLQHPPKTIIEMYRLWEQGYEVIDGVKKNRGKESGLHRIAAQTFYRLISNATHLDMSNASDFKLLDRKAVDVLLRLPERQPFFRALSSWIGFKTAVIEFEVQEREIGESKWSLKSLIKYALTNITSFSTIPLHFVTISGFLFLIFSMILGIQMLYFHYSGRALEGFTTIIILLLLIGSILMIGLGIVGYYIAKIYDEVKGRPRYIVSEIATSENEKNNKDSFNI